MRPDAPSVVIVNGTVRAEGNNSILGQGGDASLPGQVALEVNGKLIIPFGSVLTTEGGGDLLYAPVGGHGVVLNNGEIVLDKLISTGGESKSLWGSEAKGGDAVAQGVDVRTPDHELTAGLGNPNGSDTIEQNRIGEIKGLGGTLIAIGGIGYDGNGGDGIHGIGTISVAAEEVEKKGSNENGSQLEGNSSKGNIITINKSKLPKTGTSLLGALSLVSIGLGGITLTWLFKKDK